MPSSPSSIERLKTRLNTIIDDLAKLTAGIPVHYNEKHDADFVLIIPDYSWGELTAEQRAIQTQLKRNYEPVAEMFKLLLKQAPKDLIRQLDRADKQFRVWLELHSNWSISNEPAKNEAALRKDVAEFDKILSILEATGNGEIIVVPDTNSLLACVDPTKYRSVVNADSLIFMLLPTVLGELDKLKIDHKNEDVRNKAKSAITRIKGWREQGSLYSGVIVDKTIKVMANHSEPSMEETLSWLDGNVKDDRIIASVLALQAQVPSSRIVLVTDDINLQNKCDAALIETAEIPTA